MTQPAIQPCKGTSAHNIGSVSDIELKNLHRGDGLADICGENITPPSIGTNIASLDLLVSSAAMATTGSCLCGETQYEFTGEPTVTVCPTLQNLPTMPDHKLTTRPRKGICHCTHCRKLTGSAFLTFLAIPYEDFSFTKGHPESFTFEHKAGVKIDVSWCGSCGLALCKQVQGDEKIIVFAGTLDDGGVAIKKVPQVELWTADRVEWCGVVGKGGEVTGFEGFPPPPAGKDSS